MVFVTNNHVLLQFKNGTGIHFDSNGDVLHQMEEQGIYEDFKPTYYPFEITGMSEIVDGCRYLSYNTNGNTDYHHVIHYNEAGIATKVARTESTEYYTRERIRRAWRWKMYREAIAEQEAEDKKNTSSRQKKTESEPK